MEKKRIDVNGIDLVYEECGSRNKKVIVLLHGFCGSSLYWHNICPMLNEQYRVIAPNLRGHGGTSSPEGIYTMETMAEDVMKLLEALDIQKVTMFGHSLGGYVTAAFADKYSNMLNGLALIHSTIMPDSDDGKKKRIMDIEAIRDKGIGPYVRGLIPNLFNEEKLSEMRDEVDQFIKIGQEIKPEAAIATLEGMKLRPDRSHVLAEAQYPVLIVAGAADAVIKPDDSFTVTSLETPLETYHFPHILETTFEDVAHMSFVEVSDQLARVMSTYLKTLYERESTRAEA
ncbi:alpha/beta fold hydrolase [Paenibacillus sp. sgz302251]|uniref:alpha/beta fold hydrolase n=1 Tax=Paenibacillus sp. sgz302251 TaxID=3414493 RepID=UPI003C7B8B10